MKNLKRISHWIMMAVLTLSIHPRVNATEQGLDLDPFLSESDGETKNLLAVESSDRLADDDRWDDDDDDNNSYRPHYRPYRPEYRPYRPHYRPYRPHYRPYRPHYRPYRPYYRPFRPIWPLYRPFDDNSGTGEVENN